MNSAHYSGTLPMLFVLFIRLFLVSTSAFTSNALLLFVGFFFIILGSLARKAVYSQNVSWHKRCFHQPLFRLECAYHSIGACFCCCSNTKFMVVTAGDLPHRPTFLCAFHNKTSFLKALYQNVSMGSLTVNGSYSKSQSFCLYIFVEELYLNAQEPKNDESSRT